MTQKTEREIEATTYPPHVRFTFHRGMVTNGAGQELPDEAYLTYGSAASMNAEDADIEIHGGGAHEAARMIEAAPALLEYVESSASAGCATAKALIERIHGEAAGEKR